MGFLTTITIRNDCCHVLKENAEELADKIYRACLGETLDIDNHVSIGNCTPVLIVQKPHCNSSSILYLQARGTTIDITDIDGSDPDLLDAALELLKFHAKRLQNLKLQKQKEKIINKALKK